ncbi:MAG: hypothetical protein SGPRY_015030, partial [Prymnesium sp.]
DVLQLLHHGHTLVLPKWGEICWLDAWIAPLQLLAVIFNLANGLPVLCSSLGEWLSFEGAPTESQWLAALALVGSSSTTSTASFLTHDVKATFAARPVAFRLACCDVVIGLAFILLFLCSLHVFYPVSVQVRCSQPGSE